MRLLASLRPSVRMELGSHWKDFFFNLIFETFSKIENSTQITNPLHKDVFTFMPISFRIPLRMRNISNQSCTENQNTHFMFSNFSPKIVPFVRWCRTCCRSREAADNTAPMRWILISKTTRALSYARCSAPTHTDTDRQTDGRAHAHTRIRKQKHV
jgi:hypothetical protein